MLCNILTAQPFSKVDKTLVIALTKTIDLNSQNKNIIVTKIYCQ